MSIGGLAYALASSRCVSLGELCMNDRDSNPPSPTLELWLRPRLYEILAFSGIHFGILCLCMLLSIRVWIAVPTVDIPESPIPHILLWIAVVLSFPFGPPFVMLLPWHPVTHGFPLQLLAVFNSVFWGVVFSSVLSRTSAEPHTVEPDQM